MNWRTHEFLARQMVPLLRERWGELFDEKKFVAGCIKPDMTALFVTHPHFWNISKKFIYKKTDRLSGKILHSRNKKKFNEQLGIVTHYVADFFTSAHNTERNRILEHIAFEDELHRQFLSNVRDETVRALYQDPSDRHSGKHSAARKWLAREHSGYTPNMKNCTADIEPIVRACIIVSAMILAAAATKTAKISNIVIHPDFEYSILVAGGIPQHA